jgi:hypothetical protein
MARWAPVQAGFVSALCVCHTSCVNFPASRYRGLDSALPTSIFLLISPALRMVPFSLGSASPVYPPCDVAYLSTRLRVPPSLLAYAHALLLAPTLLAYAHTLLLAPTYRRTPHYPL